MSNVLTRRAKEYFEVLDSLQAKGYVTSEQWQMLETHKQITAARMTNRVIEDTLLAYGYSKGSPPEQKKYRLRWMMARGLATEIVPDNNLKSDRILDAVQVLMQQLNDETIAKLNARVKILDIRLAQISKEKTRIEFKLECKQAELLNNKKTFATKTTLLKNNHARAIKNLKDDLIRTRKAYDKLYKKLTSAEPRDKSKQLYNQVYQLKIILNDIEPKIWRIIQVPENYTFWELHVAIQNAMGWTDSHMHQFELINPGSRQKDIIGIPEHMYGGEIFDDYNTLPGWNLKLADYLAIVENKQITYLYDFGDGQRHTIQFEGIYPRNIDKKYPVCLTGERSCPPEDCGGTGGYEDFLNIIKDKHHEEYKSMRRWAGGKFDPEKCVPGKIRFMNPEKHLDAVWR